MTLNLILKSLKKTIYELSRNSCGFTLFEVLVGLAISSLILIMVYSSHTSISNAVYQMTGIADFYENSNLALGRIDKDISCAYLNRNNKNIILSGNNNFEYPFNGRLNFVSVDHQELSVLSDTRKPYPKSDVKEIGYSLMPDKKVPGLFFLSRREKRHFDDEPESGGESDILLENVVDIKFEFRRGNAWTNSWDSRQNNQFPRFIRTTLKVRNYNRQEEEFVFISKINMY